MDNLVCMNFLAHLYLSGDEPLVMLGNFIADGVKGKQWMKYPKQVQYGIKMHRFIDNYTDVHPLISNAKKQLYPFFSKYAGAVLDMYHDHFIANQWSVIHHEQLLMYTHYCYRIFYTHYELLPPKYKHMLPYMSQRNWLFNYKNLAGLHRSFTGLSKRIVNNPGIEHGAQILENNYLFFANHHHEFWPELCNAVLKWKSSHPFPDKGVNNSLVF